MWVCAECSGGVDDLRDDCPRCGASRAGSRHGDEIVPTDPTLTSAAPNEAEALLPEILRQLRTEPPRASGLAVCVWVLAVFALFPVLGIPAAVALALCSLILVIRPEPLPWDRRIGVVGLVLSLAAFASLGIWLVMVAIRRPFEVPLDLGEVAPADERLPLVIATQLAVLVVSIMLHECAHAVSACWSGDGTAARLGRISLNPLVHVDLFGSVILPVILIMARGSVLLGWAKPVPVIRQLFRSPRLGLLAVTLAGVSVNFMLAMACASGLLALGSTLRLAYPDAVVRGFAVTFADVTIEGVANETAWKLAITALKEGIAVNLVLFAFNLIPIPPLDGFGVLESVVPSSLAPLVSFLRSIGFILLVVLIATGLIQTVLLPGYLFTLLLNLGVGWMTGWA